MKTIKFLIFGLLALLGTMSFTSCHSVSVGTGEVAVLVDQPWFFGKGGIRQEVWGTGLQYTWPSTHSIMYKTIPITFEEHFENIVTKDNNPINFSVYIKISIKPDSAWYLQDKFSEEWYKQNISPRFRTKVRDKACMYEMFQLTSQREIVTSIEKELESEMKSYVCKIKMPLLTEAFEVNVGSVQPQPEVLKEIAATAAKVQSQKTQIEEGKFQDERNISEGKRARADLAYMNKMGLNKDQFVQLETIKMYKESAAAGTTMIFGNLPGITLNK